jgi:hypothetical protein
VEPMSELKRKDEDRRQSRAAGPANDAPSLKAADTSDSLEASVTCKCGAEIRQYADRVVGVCTCVKVQPMSQVTEILTKGR